MFENQVDWLKSIKESGADLWSDIGTQKLGNDNKPVLVKLHTLSEAI